VCQDTISLFLALRQHVIFGFPEWRLKVWIKFCQTLVARISQEVKNFREITAIVLE
jgi:hypothetical protein